MKKILFVDTEISPYVPDTALGTQARLFSEAAQESGCEVRTFMPKWGTINERRGQLHEVIRLSGANIIVNDSDHALLIKVASLPVSRVQIYFIDSEDYFPRLRGEEALAPIDPTTEFNQERALYFAKGVIETIIKLKWEPDLIICSGWASARMSEVLGTTYKDNAHFMRTSVMADGDKQIADFAAANGYALDDKALYKAFDKTLLTADEA